MPTVVAVRGTEAAGKTALYLLMMQGQSQYWASPRLNSITPANTAFVWPAAFMYAEGGRLPVLPLVQKALGNKEYLVLESSNTTDRALLEEAGEHYKLLRVWLIVPHWMIEARRCYRLLRAGWATEDTLKQHPIRIAHQDTQPYAEVLKDELEFHPESILTLDARDFPIVEVSHENALRIAKNEIDDWEKPTDFSYQRALRIGTKWIGNPDFIEYQTSRYDTILPADMSGMDLLDVGARNGTFCWEAINRGALWAVAVDRDPEAAEILRQLRNKYEYPVTVAELDTETAILPRMTFKPLTTVPPRYSLALLSNVLHHVKDPVALLRNTLLISDAVVAETPPLLGRRWPGWVYAVADGIGFAVTSMEPATVHPESRTLFKMERIDG